MKRTARVPPPPPSTVDVAPSRTSWPTQVDIPGFNYKPMQYEKILKDHPDWIIFGAETASARQLARRVSSADREVREARVAADLTSYDIIAPPWAYCPTPSSTLRTNCRKCSASSSGPASTTSASPRRSSAAAARTPTDWPSRSSYFGMVDLAGFPKDRYYLYQSVWTKKPMVHVLPHWNWEAGRQGYSRDGLLQRRRSGAVPQRQISRPQEALCEPVELPVGPNISRDRKFSSKYRLLWQVPYSPGSLKAVAYQSGQPVAVDEMRTAGVPARVKLIPDRATITADGDDLSFVTVRVEDKDGNLCPAADNL